MDGTSGLEPDRGRQLVARVLNVVQGHPKLIELANGQAEDPAALEARLGDAAQAWLAGEAKLDAFFQEGESAVSVEDYLRVLDRWTRGAASTLPEDAATLFLYLCCLEEGDRVEPLVTHNWADVWQRLERAGDTPDLETAVAPLVNQGLVEVARDDEGHATAYRLHPGVAAAGRTEAGAGFRTSVDTEIAAYWTGNLQHALQSEDEKFGWLVLRAGLSAAPYLLRLDDWAEAGGILEAVTYRDKSTSTVASVLPLLRHIAEASAGTDAEFMSRGRLAKALVVIQPGEAETQLKELLDIAVAREEFVNASIVTTDLVNLARRRGRLSEALVLAEQMQEYSRRAGFGPWTQLSDEGQRLQILSLLGHDQEVLDRVYELRDAMASLPEKRDASEGVEPFRVREVLLDTGRSAAASLGRWEEALEA